MVTKIQAFTSFNDKLFFSEVAALQDEMKSEIDSLIVDWSTTPPASTEEWLEFIYENPEALVRVLSPMSNYLAHEREKNEEMKRLEQQQLEEGKVR